MKDLLTYLIINIVNHPDDVKVNQTGDNNKLTLAVHVNKEDIGLVIGKQGRIIRAVRDLTKLAAAKHGIFVDVVLAENEV